MQPFFHSVPMDDGAVLAVREYDGPGDVVVLLHDLDCSGAYWTPVVERLRELAPDLRIVVPDLRGHGASTAGEEPSRKRLVKDMKRLVKSMALDAPVMCGHGWGADIALACDFVPGVVAINPLLGRAHAPIDGDLVAPTSMTGALPGELTRSLVGVQSAKPLRRSRRDAPLLLVYGAELDGVAVTASEVVDAAAEVLAWQCGSRHLPLEAPSGIAALLWSWILEVA